MQNYIVLSLETHLFFARIMKEHALFLEAGFPCKEKECIEKASCFRAEFESLLFKAVQLAGDRICSDILTSDELVTEFTIPAEKKTSFLSGVPIDSDISAAEQRLRSGSRFPVTKELMQSVYELNNQSMSLLNGLISFKESILREVSNGKLYTFNYPLLIEHILREAKLYRDTIRNIMQRKYTSRQDLLSSEIFWNQIMMEHAQFIRGLLDPCEDELIRTADDFAKTYSRLLEEAKAQDCAASYELHCRTLNTTLQYKEFKTAGTQGILNNQIVSIILPLLADHVLREANHFIRILKYTDQSNRRM